jgi:hypothetical protein
MSDDWKNRLITDPAQLRLTVDAPKPDIVIPRREGVTVLPGDDPKQVPIGWKCYEVVSGSPEAEEWDKELQPHRWTETDESDKYRSTWSVQPQKLDRWGGTVIPVLEFLNGRPWNNAALNVVHALRPSSIRVTTGEMTCDSMSWRVTVHIDPTGIIRKIDQEVDVGLIGCRYGADVSAYIDGRTPRPGGHGGIINPRGLKKLLDDPKETK